MGDLKAFVDSNVIISHLEGKLDLSELRSKYTLCSNAIVFSEVFMVYLKAITGKKSYELKKGPELIIERKDELEELFMLFEIFEELEINKEVRNLAYEFVKKYGLLPNDALILSTCKYYGIKYLISFDGDFRKACKEEGIELVGSV
ncbi:MAG: uncharacterized protein PWR13_934 [Archaeoglobi archaeon]|nr:uncharacterized protein [Archaeoglobi archaeon]MDK2781906.1 uncharacterized protein [Archaeoglobi archaeon]